MTSCIALLESNTSGTGRLFAAAARRFGYRPVLLAAQPERYCYAREDGVDVVRCATEDPAQVDAVCASLAAEGLGGITSSSEYFVVHAATAAKRLGLPGPDHEALARCRDKRRQREALKARDIPIPRFSHATSVDAARAAAEILGLPVIVKPLSGSGSVGVRLCTNLDEVGTHSASLLAQTTNERGQPVPHGVLVEELAVGPEYSVETFGHEIIAVTAKHLGALPHFVEVGHDQPPELDETALATLGLTATSALQALGLSWGPAHVELRWTEHGPVIIEVNPRLAGGFIPELVRLTTGVDMIASTIALAIGGRPSLERTRRDSASIRFVVIPGEGLLSFGGDLDEVATIPGIAEVRLYQEAGTAVTRRYDFRDRVGHVIALGQTPSQARSVADQGVAALSVGVRMATHPARGS